MKRTVFILFICVLFTGFATVTAQESVFVSAAGDNNNSGLTEAEPVKTLAKAIEIVKVGNINKITVIGTLDVNSEGRINQTCVFEITNVPGEILITGKTRASSRERAVISAKGSDKSAIMVSNSIVQFENIEISGAEAEKSNGLSIILNAQVTLGQGAVIKKNSNMGILIGEKGNCIIDGGEVRENKSGGIAVMGGSLILQNGFVRNNSASGVIVISNFTMNGGTISGNKTTSVGGGVSIFTGGTFSQTGGSITGNTANNVGGGVFVYSESTFNQTGGNIRNNTAGRGSPNIYRTEGSLGSNL